MCLRDALHDREPEPGAHTNALRRPVEAFEDTGSALVEKWRLPMGYVPFASFGVGPDGSVYTYRSVRDGGNAELTILRLDPATGDILDTSETILSSVLPIDVLGPPAEYWTVPNFDMGFL